MRSTLGKASWSEIYKRRLAWADAGLADFVAALHDSEIQDLYHRRSRGDSIVITYGPSQVGKTTVLLHMLGIAADSEAATIVESVLRAGRPRGASASATSMRYAIASDNRWHLWAGGQTLVTDEAEPAKEFLASVRAQINEDPAAFKNPMRVDIPAHFAVKVQPCIIIDLPGVDSRDELEQRHVAELLKHWLPIASIVLIVLRKDNVSELERLECNQDLRLRLEPSHYRLVLTYATSAASDRQFLERDWDGSLAGWRQHIMVDLVRTIPELFDEERDTHERLAIYPFEVGESRRKFSPSFERLVAPLLDESAEAIRHNLDTTAEGLLIQQADYHRIVEDHYKKEQARRIAAYQILEAALERARGRLERHRTDAKLAESAEADVTQEVQRWTALALRFAAFSLPDIPVKRDHNKLTEFTTALDAALLQHLQTAFDDIELDLPNWLRSARQEFIASLHVKLSKHYGGFTSIFRSQKQRRALCEREALPTVRQLEDKARRAVGAFREKQLKMAESRQAAAQDRYEGAVQNCQTEAQFIREQEQRIKELLDNHNKKCDDEAAEVDIAHQFWVYLDEAWCKQDAQLAQAFAAARSRPHERLAISLERGIRALAWRRLHGGAS